MKWPNGLSLKWWIGDPNNNHASVRKMAGWVCVVILLETAQVCLFGTPPDTATLITLFTTATAGCGIYAAGTPTRDKAGNSPPPS